MEAIYSSATPSMRRATNILIRLLCFFLSAIVFTPSHDCSLATALRILHISEDSHHHTAVEVDAFRTGTTFGTMVAEVLRPQVFFFFVFLCRLFRCHDR